MSVYFMTCRTLGVVKIGYSCNPRRRWEALQSGCPLPIVVEATLTGGAAEEALLHERFADARRDGEWFTITDEIEALIAARRAAQGDKWLARHDAGWMRKRKARAA